VLGTWFGAGLLPVMPGTWGSLAALPCAWAIRSLWGVTGLAIGAAIVFAVGCWAAGTIAKTTGIQDPGAIVIDEVAAQWLVLLPTPLHPLSYAAAFVLFRIFDIWKPWPVRWADRRVHGGLGIMLDDLLAAVYAVLLFLVALMTGGASVFEAETLTLAQSVLDACRARNWRLATAESCTGGLVAGALTAIAGSSDVVERGFVTYSNEAKSELLGVPPETIAAHGAVSAETAAAMAQGALARAPVDLAVSVAGIAGPGGATPTKPVGLVLFGLARRGGECRTERRVFPGDRSQVRQAALEVALQLLDDEARG